jgi:hypothetical protein
MRAGSRRISVAILVFLASAMLAGAPLALAVFNKTIAGGPLTVATSTLAASAKGTAAQVNCRTNKTPEIEVSWSATSSTYASSYTVERATASAGPYSSVASVAIGQTSYIDKSAALGYSTTYYYRVVTVFYSWSATSTSASVKTLSKICLSS